MSKLEERQNLLEDNVQRENEDIKDVPHRRARSSIWSWLALPVVLLTVLALSGIAQDFSSFTVLKPVAESEGHGHHEMHEEAKPVTTSVLPVPSPSPVPTAHPAIDRSPNDYLLDPQWDFDAEPQRREYHWTVKERNHSADGVPRLMILVNDQFPGPLVEANEGDTVVVHVNNKATNATSIHWHGLYQNGTNYMDGTVGVTQCPIAPGSNFTYEFKVAGQSGTYWWHSHVSAQSSDGMYGPFIIHSKVEKEYRELQYSSDRVVMVSDFYYNLSSSLLMKYLESDRENIEPVPDTALINGKGIRDCSTIHNIHGHKHSCDNSTEGVGWLDMTLQAGQMHRLRIVNTGAFAEIQVSLDGHEFAITEVDGVDLMPERFHRLTILPAQRYSIVIDPGTASKSLWLRAKMLPTCFAEKNRNLQLETRAVIRFEDQGQNTDKEQLPMSKDWDDQTDLICKDMNTSSLVPLQPLAAPAKADATFYLRSNFEIGAYRLSRGFFNQSSFRPDITKPTLFRAIDGLATSNSSFETKSPAMINEDAFDSNNELVIQTKGVQVIDLIVSNFDDGNHPLHLHGYKYWVLAQGHGYPPSNLTDSLDITNPLRRDTATVEAFGWMLIRVLADNPGTWAFHCHVTWHSEAGLMMQLLTRSDELQKQAITNPNLDLCRAPLSELRKGGTPDDQTFMSDD